MNGPSLSSIEVVLGAESLPELLDRIDLAERVASQDARIVRDATTYRKRVTKREKDMTAARARQVVVVDQLAQEKREIEGKLAERERLLASVRDEIAQLVEEAERRRQAELRRQAQLELARQQRLAQALAQQAAAASVGGPIADGDGLLGTAPSVNYVAPPADASRGAQVVAIAMQFLGIPYVWGAADPLIGFDCSGLTTYVFAKIGVSLPHHAASQYTLGFEVPKEQLQPVTSSSFGGSATWGCTSEAATSFTHLTPATSSRSPRSQILTTSPTG